MNYNEIIQETAREHLIPLGVFQKGRSRCFIDDNGWFFTVIEFQPSVGTGTYLNAAMHFLWKSPLREYLSFDFAVNGSRVKGLLLYENEAHVSVRIQHCLQATFVAWRHFILRCSFTHLFS